MGEGIRHWSEDCFWVEAMGKYHKIINSGKTEINLNLDDIEKIIFDGGSPAYKLMHAMHSVHELERHDGYRGAPRLALALLLTLMDLTSNN